MTLPRGGKRPKKLLTELKTRGLGKPLAIYLSAALTSIGIVNIFSLRYQLPQWLFDGFLVFIIFGFFNAFIYGWFRGREHTPGTKLSTLTAHTLVVLAAAGVAAHIVSIPRTALLPRNAKTIAVLPFKNMSDNAENEFFADGMTEDILTQLSKIEDLRVISRTSVMQYKETKKSLREIGMELGAGTILEGSVRYSGDRVRIVGQLINAQTDEHLWAETYDREIRNIFAIQSDVAQKIAAALKATLSPDEIRNIEQEPTQNLEAYGYYLKGRELYYRYTNEDNERAIGMFRKAIAIDSGYAQAYAGLADTYGQRVQRFGFDVAWTDSAIALCYRAIELDPHIAEPYKALGLAFNTKGWYTKALQQYSIAIQKNPNLSTAVSNKGLMMLWTGDPEGALPFIQKSMILTPGRANNEYHLASVYESLGLDSLAIVHLWRCLELAPTYTFVYRELSRIIYVRGRKQEAIRLMDSIAVHEPDDPSVILGQADLQFFEGDLTKAEVLFRKTLDLLSIESGPTTQLGYLAMKKGDSEDAKIFLEHTINVSLAQIDNLSENYEFPYELAKAYAILGDTALSLSWLGTAISGGWLLPQYTEIDPQFEGIRQTAGYRDALHGVRARIADARSRVLKKGLIQ